MLAAGADNRLRPLIVEAILALELAGNGFAQRLDAEHRRIFRFAALDGGNAGLLDIVGRIEVRLTHRQGNDVAACILEVTRFLRRRDGRGRLYAGKGVGKKGHDGTPGRIWCGRKGGN